MTQGLRPGGSEAFGALFRVGGVGRMTDDQLLGEFLSRRDAAGEAAFEALATRHGPAVLSVCRAVLRDEHSAQEAFQATFLILARRAGSVRDRVRLGAWLHRVARRVALRARAASARRQAREVARADLDAVAVAAEDPAGRREAAEAVHEEVDRLPARYRVPVVLCHLEGLSYEEAAHRLDCPVGTVRSRLSRARDRLRDRLTRRGLAPAVALIGAEGTASAMSPSVPGPLIVTTSRFAAAFAAGREAAGAVPAAVTTLAEGALKAMSWARMSRIGALTLVVGLAAGVGLRAAQDPGKEPAGRKASEVGATDGEAPVPTILKNGGIEEGGARPTGWQHGPAIPGVQYLRDGRVAHKGKGSLSLKKTAARFFPIAQWFQTVPHDGKGKALKVGAWIKASKSTKAVLDVQFYDGSDQQLDHQWAAYIGPRDDGDGQPITHDWKHYEAVVAVPDGTKSIAIAPQIYGPGSVWFDDITASYTDEEASAEPDFGDGQKPAGAAASTGSGEDGLADVTSVERTAGGDPQKRYFLVGPAGDTPAPAEGHHLLVILPGGDGGVDFNPFVRGIAKHALPPGYLVAEPVAVRWTPEQAENVVWPVSGDKLPGVKFSTEEFVEAVIADVRKEHKVDPRHITVLGWSSGGPPAYALALRKGSGVTGAFVAMSVFHPDRYRSLDAARGRAFYLLHSPTDFIPIRMAESAREALGRVGAQAELKTYEGGHGWHGDIFGEIRRGIDWLEGRNAGG